MTLEFRQYNILIKQEKRENMITDQWIKQAREKGILKENDSQEIIETAYTIYGGFEGERVEVGPVVAPITQEEKKQDIKRNWKNLNGQEIAKMVKGYFSEGMSKKEVPATYEQMKEGFEDR